MPELNRLINEPLRLKLKLQPADDTLFVKARVTAPGGSLINEVELAVIGNGVYEDDLSELMPNLPEVKANYLVFYDAGFTEEACEHGAFEVFRRDDFDPKTLVPTGNNVNGLVTTSKVFATVDGPGMITGEVKNNDTKATVTSSEVNGEVKTNNEIKGVVYE